MDVKLNEVTGTTGSTNKFKKQFNEDKNNEKRKRFFSNNHSMKKRTTAKILQRPNDIYITNKSNFKAQLKNCEEILNSDIGEVYIHCLGNAINRGINLALTLQEKSSDLYSFEANTSTVELVDDFHPLKDDEDFAIQTRYNSCLHIRLFRYSSMLKK